MRSSVLILAVILAGCGKSFQEADAIYKDEVAKLKSLEHQREAAFWELRAKHYDMDKDPGEDRRQFEKDSEEADARFADAIKAQKARVRQAFDAKEAAK